MHQLVPQTQTRQRLWESRGTPESNQSSDDICSMMKYETYDSSNGKAVLESGDEVSSATAQSLKEEQQGGDQLQMSVWNFLNNKIKVF